MGFSKLLNAINDGADFVLEAINATTLGRIEPELRETSLLLKAISDVTLEQVGLLRGALDGQQRHVVVLGFAKPLVHGLADAFHHQVRGQARAFGEHLAQSFLAVQLRPVVGAAGFADAVGVDEADVALGQLDHAVGEPCLR
jgi:hypothetical protein